jgi:ubiquinol-cytochrome c reductase cytochrome b subunit
MTSFFAWLDDRTGYRGLLRAALFERIPGGARWRYVWGSTLTFALFVQFVTGVVLWASYSANAQGAWESVYFIQNEMLGGWVLRGVHHYMAQVTTVLLVIHLMQVVIDGAYRAPREVNFWFGLALLFLVLSLSLTGYLLPWDQKGFWATKVATSIVSITPVVGPSLQRLLIGGAEYGHHTLTRFFALHAGVVPGLIVLLVIGHVYLFRRHGVKAVGADRPGARDGVFWPDQMLRDSVASLAVMAAVLFLVFWTGGAELGAPADPTEPYAAARPEWYFMFLFQWLKYFPSGTEVIGAHLVPGLVVTLVALMPVFARWRLGHRFNVGLLVTLLLGMGMLTRLAFAEDAVDMDYAAAKAEAAENAARVVELARAPTGIPPTGALALLHADPRTQGPRLFSSNCSNCHRYDGHDGLGGEPSDEQSASDLKGFGSREWLAGLLDVKRVRTVEYFGGTEHARGRMQRFVRRRVARFDDERRAALAKVIAAVSAEAELPSQAARDSVDHAEIEEGLLLINDESIHCTRCHTFHGVTEDDVGPELTGWGSREWMLGLLQNPEHEAYYGEDNDRMPGFGEEEILTQDQMELIVDWLREDWYRPGR